MSELDAEKAGREVVRRLPKIRGGIQPLAAELAPPPVAPLLVPDEAGDALSALFEPTEPIAVRSALFEPEELDEHLFEPLLDRPREEATWPEGLPLEALSALDDLLPEEPASPPVRIAPLLLDLGSDDQTPPPLPDAAAGSGLLAELDFDVDEDPDAEDLASPPELEGTGSSVSALGAAVSLLPPAESLASPASADAGPGALDAHGWFTELPQPPADDEPADAGVAVDPLPEAAAVQAPAKERRRVLPALAAALLGGVIGLQLEPLIGAPSEEATVPNPTVSVPVAARSHSGHFSAPASGLTGHAVGESVGAAAVPTLRLVAVGEGSAQHLSGSVSSRGVRPRSGAGSTSPAPGGEPDLERASDDGSGASPADEARSLRLSDFVWEGGAPPPQVVAGKIRRIARSSAVAPGSRETGRSEGAMDLGAPERQGSTLSEELAAATALQAKAPPVATVEQSALTPEEVSRVVAGLRSSWRQCAQAQALRHPGVHGTLNLRWDILPDGTTAAASVESSRWSESPLARCVLARLATAQFPASGQRISPVLLPLRF